MRSPSKPPLAATHSWSPQPVIDARIRPGFRLECQEFSKHLSTCSTAGLSGASASPYTGWAGFNYDTGQTRERVKAILLECAKNDIRPVSNTNVSPGLIDLLEEVDREVPLKGRRWVIGHINVLSPHDIERIVRMGLVVTRSLRTGACATRIPRITSVVLTL